MVGLSTSIEAKRGYASTFLSRSLRNKACVIVSFGNNYLAVILFRGEPGQAHVVEKDLSEEVEKATKAKR